MTRNIAYLCLLVLVTAAFPVRAEWITERLYLGLYPEPDTSASPLRMLPTGEEVEILQRQGDFVQLQLDDGTQGWARAEFIAEQPPAAVRIDQVAAERDSLQQQLEQANADRQTGQQTINELQQKLAQANTSAARLRNRLESEQQESANAQEVSETVAEQQQRIEALQSELSASEQQAATLESQIQSLQGEIKRKAQTSDNMLLKIVWVLASMLVCLVIGVVLGARWMAARVRKRFNGLKVW